ncbi:substrate-binding periplasmic protein [Hahella ganghwensis]|uniref:substrate-binding periplasmic protein n=1 Tax=Hahella ganghwensis TaxID=286420 RepID=UPI00035E511A|nr:ABC transporter substrate-binding protein [Hahella ganghwensis]
MSYPDAKPAQSRRFQHRSKVYHIRNILFFALIYCTCGWAQADAISIYTEEFPPYNYTSDETVDGVSTRIIREVMNRTGLAYTLNVYPWTRSYRETLDHQNTFIYSISRLKEREGLFKWVGKIVPAGYSVFTLQGNQDIKVETLEDMKRYRIGTTVNDAREVYLLSKGFDVRHFDRLSGEDANTRNYLKLKAGRIDLWPIPDAVAYHIARSQGDNPKNRLRRVYALSELSNGYYLATNINTADQVLESVRRSLAHFKASKEYMAILKNWGLEELYEQCVDRYSSLHAADEC